MEPVSPRLERVVALGDHRVEVTFSDGHAAVVDLRPLLGGRIFEPILRDLRLFGEVRVSAVGGALEWPNGADLDPEILYQYALRSVV